MSDRIGAFTALPRSFVRSDILVCCGEDERELEAALDAARWPSWQKEHIYRGGRFHIRGGVLTCAVGLATPVVEALLWELLRTGEVQRIVLIGTAGALPACDATPLRPYLLDPIRSAMQAIDCPPEAQWEPNMDLGLPRVPCVSTDRFYGFSPATMDDYPAEAAMIESWARYRKANGVVDMEAAPFHAFCERFDPTGKLLFGAVKAIANPVADLDALPEAAGQALEAVARAVRPVFFGDEEE